MDRLPVREYDFIPDIAGGVKYERRWIHWTLFRYLDNVLGVLDACLGLTIPRVGVNVGQGQSLFFYDGPEVLIRLQLSC